MLSTCVAAVGLAWCSPLAPPLGGAPAGARVSTPLAMSLQPPLLLRPQPALVLGSSLLFFLVTNRLFTEDLLNSQSRADLIATIAPTLIMLQALADLDITPRAAEPVALQGEQAAWTEPALPATLRAELEWASDALLGGPCASVAIVRGERTLLLRGTLPRVASPERAVQAGPLLEKTLRRTSGAPDYLPALQLLPGRVEFTYLPENTQGVLMVPLLGGSAQPGALILAANQQRGFAEDDVEWARAVGARLAACMDASDEPVE